MTLSTHRQYDVVALHGVEWGMLLRPGDWVRLRSREHAGCGVLVGFAEGDAVVLWSQVPRDETHAERMARQLSDEIDADILSALAAADEAQP